MRLSYNLYQMSHWVSKGKITDSTKDLVMQLGMLMHMYIYFVSGFMRLEPQLLPLKVLKEQ